MSWYFRIACVLLGLCLSAGGAWAGVPLEGEGVAEGQWVPEAEEALDCTDTLAGVIDATSPRWNRAIADTASISLACHLEAVDSDVDGAAYTAIPIHAVSGVALSVSVLPQGTTIPDTVLYLYCQGFDPNDPTHNLIAFNDDFGDSLTSGFDAAQGLTLVPGYTYWLVLSTFAGVPESEGALEVDGAADGEATVQPAPFGSYVLCLGGNYAFGEFVPEATTPTECPLTSEFSQPVDTTFTANVLPSNNAAGRQAYDLITGVESPIVGLRWWGVTGSQFNVACDPAQLTYNVSFAERGGLIPVGVVADFNLTPTITDAGFDLFGMPVHLFEVTFPEPVLLPFGDGFVSVYTTNSFATGCRFSWNTSAFGDSASTTFNFSSLFYESKPNDLAFCLVTEPTCPGQQPDSVGTYKVQLIDPVLSSVVSDAVVKLTAIPNIEFTGVYDAPGQFFSFDCLPYDEYSLVDEAPGYSHHDSLVDFHEPVVFDNLFLETAEGEGEGGGCKGCNVRTTVFVTVLDDATEKGIKTGTVTLVGTLAGETSNTNGVYVIPELSDGTYTIRAEAVGYVPAERAFTVGAQATLSVTLRLSALQGGTLFNHSGDADNNGQLSLGELLGIIQLYNAGQYRCDGGDGYLPGAGSHACAPHSCDYLAPGGNFVLSLSELLRGIQIYAARHYYRCDDGFAEDGYCLGTP